MYRSSLYAVGQFSDSLRHGMKRGLIEWNRIETWNYIKKDVGKQHLKRRSKTFELSKTSQMLDLTFHAGGLDFIRAVSC